MACQDVVHNTLVYRRNTLGLDTPAVRCSVYHKAQETIMHLLSACLKYVVTSYVQQDIAALLVLYFYLRHYYSKDETQVLLFVLEHIEFVLENVNCRLYLNYLFCRLRRFQENKPYITLLDHMLSSFRHSEKTIFLEKRWRRCEKYMKISSLKYAGYIQITEYVWWV